MNQQAVVLRSAESNRRVDAIAKLEAYKITRAMEEMIHIENEILHPTHVTQIEVLPRQPASV